MVLGVIYSRCPAGVCLFLWVEVGDSGEPEHIAHSEEVSQAQGDLPSNMLLWLGELGA